MSIDIEIKEIIELTEKQVIQKFAQRKKIPLSMARNMFHSSKTYAALEMESTGLWKESVEYIIYEFEQESKLQSYLMQNRKAHVKVIKTNIQNQKIKAVKRKNITPSKVSRVAYKNYNSEYIK